MKDVSSTADLYDVLCRFGIPVLNEDGTPRLKDEIVTDMFRAWNHCGKASDSRIMADAINWLAANGGEFNEGQLLALNWLRIEQREMDEKQRKKEIAKESDRALEEFLSGFKIVGGEAL